MSTVQLNNGHQADKATTALIYGALNNLADAGPTGMIAIAEAKQRADNPEHRPSRDIGKILDRNGITTNQGKDMHDEVAWIIKAACKGSGLNLTLQRPTR